ncbi:MAG: PKD domain-containing protein [Candidatus Zixiibacteriota bacterium]
MPLSRDDGDRAMIVMGARHTRSTAALSVTWWPTTTRGVLTKGLLWVAGAMAVLWAWATPAVSQDWDSAYSYVSQPSAVGPSDSCAYPEWRAGAYKSRWYSYASPNSRRVPILSFRIGNEKATIDTLLSVRVHSMCYLPWTITRMYLYRDQNGTTDTNAYLDGADVLLDSVDVLDAFQADLSDSVVFLGLHDLVGGLSSAWYHLLVDIDSSATDDATYDNATLAVEVWDRRIQLGQASGRKWGPPSVSGLSCPPLPLPLGTNAYPIIIDNRPPEGIAFMVHKEVGCADPCDAGETIISLGDSVLVTLDVAVTDNATDTNATGWPKAFLGEFGPTVAPLSMKRHSAQRYSYPDSSGAEVWLKIPTTGVALPQELPTSLASSVFFELKDVVGNVGLCSLFVSGVDTEKPSVAPGGIGLPRGFQLQYDPNGNVVVDPGDSIRISVDSLTEPPGEICDVTATLVGWYAAPLKLTLTDPGGTGNYAAVHRVGPGLLQANAGTQLVWIVVTDNACNSDSLAATLTAAVDIVVPDVIWVDTAGSDVTGDGSYGAPFRTIQYALDVSGPDKTVMVRPGIYQGPIDFPEMQTTLLRSEQGPFVTTIVGSGSAIVPVVTMAVGGLADSAMLDGFTIRDNSLSAVCAGCAGGIYVEYPTRAVISNNIIAGNVATAGSGGISFHGLGGLIANNWIVDNQGDGGSPGALLLRDDANVKVVNNTIVGNYELSGSAAAGIRIIDINGDGQTNLLAFDNNIVAFNGPGSGFVATTLGAGAFARNNLYYNNGDGNTCPVSVSNCGWIFADPLFRNAPSGDYHLTCSSPARNNGSITSVPGSLLYDIDGDQSRTTAGKVDIGADQFYDEDKHAIFYPNDTTVCTPYTAVFINHSTCIDENWLWTFGDGGSSTAKNPVHAYGSAGDYTVRLVAWGDKDADTAYGIVHVVAPVTADFSASTTVGCKPLDVTFTPSPINASLRYVWDFGDGVVDSSTAVVTHRYDSAGVWTVILRVRSACGTTTVTKTSYITVKPPPTISITSDWVDPPPGPVCIPHTVTFGYLSDQPITAFQWDFGDNHFSTDSTPTHTYTDADTFGVQLTATSACGTTVTVRRDYIKLVPRPTATVSVTPTFLCAGQSTVRCSAAVTGQYISSEWYFGDGSAMGGPVAEHAYGAIGYYHPFFVLESMCGTDTVRATDSVGVGDQPLAAFAVSSDSGYEPFTAAFTDQSTNIPSSWQWEFGDGNTSNLRNPTNRYPPGVYQARLIALNPCGADTSASREIVVGGFAAAIVDSVGTSGDTIRYSVRVDTLVIPYDHTVTLAARLTTKPRRGTMTFSFSPSSGVPSLTSELRAIPTRDLATGDYTVEFAATDSARTDDLHAPVKKIATRSLHYVADPLLSIFPSPLVMDSAQVGFSRTDSVTLTNTSTVAEACTLTIQTPTTSGSPFDIFSGSGGTLAPQKRLKWQVRFSPLAKGDFKGWVRVRSNDPAAADDTIRVSGRGIGEQTPPRVASTSPAQGTEATIDDEVHFTFSETMVTIPLDTILSVRSRRDNAAIPGQARLMGLSLDFSPDRWFLPDDTITVILRAIVTDTNGNRLDGDSNGVEDGPPHDDYRLVFYTGPGVYPGDADRSGRIDEADILPLGLFYGLTGPEWPHIYPGLSIQPAHSWTPRAATYANTDGNDRIDSIDICAIAEYFDRDTGLAKLHHETWLAETRQWPASVLDALIAGLEDCQGNPPGQSALRVLLEEARAGQPGALPRDFALEQNYPNPFNPATVIVYSLPARTAVRLEVFDILGHRVTTLVDGEQEAGRYRALWDGRDDTGYAVGSGIYFSRLATPHYQQTRKMVLLK